MRKLQSQKGFSLIEVTVVLAIVGLLLFGLIKAPQLIQQGKVKKQLKQIEQIQSAIIAYQDMKKGVLPGDSAKDGAIDASPAALKDLSTEKLIVGKYTAAGDTVTNAFGGTLDVINGSYVSSGTGNIIEITGLPAEFAAYIDSVMDDGLATSGDVEFEGTNGDAGDPLAVPPVPPTAATIARLIVKLN